MEKNQPFDSKSKNKSKFIFIFAKNLKYFQHQNTAKLLILPSFLRPGFKSVIFFSDIWLPSFSRLEFMGVMQTSSRNRKS